MSYQLLFCVNLVSTGIYVNPGKYNTMKQIAFFMTVLCVAQVFGQNPELSIASPGADNTLYYSNVQNQNDVSQSRGLRLNEVGLTLGQDYTSGDNPHMYLEGRLGLRHGKHLWVLA